MSRSRAGQWSVPQRLVVRRSMALVLGMASIGCKPEVLGGLRPPAQAPPVTAPADLRPISGDSQAAPTGTLLPRPLAVRVYDSVGNPYPNVTVDWTLSQSGQLGLTQTITDSTGTARNTWRLGDSAGYQFAIASSAPLAPVTFVSRAILIFQSIAISPKTVSIQTGGSQQFSTSGVFTDGSIGVPNVSYSASGGIITPQGLYAAGPVSGTFAVIARQIGGSLADTAVVSLIAPGAFLTRVILAPSSATLARGESLQFTATGQMSDGSTIIPSVTYSATGGAVTPGGLYTAGSNPGAGRVVASAFDMVSGTVADTSARIRVRFRSCRLATPCIVCIPVRRSSRLAGTPMEIAISPWRRMQRLGAARPRQPVHRMSLRFAIRRDFRAAAGQSRCTSGCPPAPASLSPTG